MMTGKEFIEKCLKADIGEIIDNKKYYHAFALMCIGIEFLGKCLNSHDIQIKGRSSEDFNNALDTYPSLIKYKGINDLYSVLRCGLLHSFLPKDGVKLTDQDNDFSTNTIGCTSLYSDFVEACDVAINNTLGFILRNLDEPQLDIKGVTSGTTAEMKSL